jgi:hypothetical protein
MKWLAVYLMAAVAAMAAPAPEPIVGRWLLVSQELGGQKTPIDELTLRITSSPKGLDFAYSVPVNNIQFVSMRFTAKPDGSAADVIDANSKKVGVAKVKKNSALAYTLILEGTGRPTATGAMTISKDGKTLISQSDSKKPGQTNPVHMVQTFSRQ